MLTTHCSLGYSVSLSEDGVVLAIGGIADSNDVGATWVFRLDNSGSSYIQIASKLVGGGSTGGEISQGQGENFLPWCAGKSTICRHSVRSIAWRNGAIF